MERKINILVPIYAIIDIETTGGRPDRDRITEIAIVIHDGTKVLQKFETLINPECYIPTYITQLTHITNDMVSAAPRFFEVAKEIVQLTEGKIFVAHNVRFDYGFVKEEFRRLGYSYQRKQLCTVRMARKTLPQLRRHNLDTLLEYYDIVVPPDQRHRAMGDAAATAVLFEYLIQQGGGLEIIEAEINKGIKEAKLPPNISLELLHSLPDACGVYYFINADGHITYIGKALNIKKRVMQHFADLTGKETALHASVHDISYEITGSELVSLLLESHEIKTKQPEYNKAQRRRSTEYGVYQYENQNGYICFHIDKCSKQKNQQAISTFAELSDAKMIVNEVVKEYGLCRKLCNLDAVAGKTCAPYFYGQCKGACKGEEEVAAYNSRVKEAISFIRKDFQQDMFIFDTGRNPEENAVILIENGQYQGFGFVNASESYTQEDLKNAVNPYQHNPETVRIIKMMMRKTGFKLKVK